MKSREKDGIAFYVATNGNDAWSGKRATANQQKTDGPFAALERARDAIRELKKSSDLPAGGVTVWLRGGDYIMEKSFELAQEDSGTDEAPIIYRAYKSEQVRLLGGRAITELKHVKNPEILERLDEQARSHVLYADLKDAGISDFGQLRSRGFSRKPVPAHMELFFGGHPMTLARWPNDCFATITRMGKRGEKNESGMQFGMLEEGFHYEGDRPRRWKNLKNIWVHGYWAYDWANTYEEVDTVDTMSRLIKTKAPYGVYGYRNGNRFYFLNILEELDTPGEYYVDRDTGTLYFWPPKPWDENEVLVSLLEDPMVKMHNVSHLILQGIKLECTRGHGIVMQGGSGNLVAGCTICNVGNHGVVISGGTNHGVQSSDIYETGDSAIEMSGGDRKTLTSCGHYADNNHIRRFGLWSRCYVYAVHIAGVGMRTTHNLIYDAPHTAILYLGNENLIEFNEIHHVCTETGDAGGIYTGRSYTARGNTVRYNYLHDIIGYRNWTNAMYFDDCVSGQVLYGNIFRKVVNGVLIGGGRDNIVENNIFIDCHLAVRVDGRGLTWGKDNVYGTMRKDLDEMNHHNPPYSDRYPELQKLDAYYEKSNGIPPENNTISRNICIGGKWMDISEEAKEKHLNIGKNLVNVDPHFIDVEKRDYHLKNDSPAYKTGFEQIPVEKIGLYDDEYRTGLKTTE